MNLNFFNNPLEQFEIRDLFIFNAPILNNIYISITNISLYILFSFLLIVLLNLLTENSKKLIYNN
jgi:hypothetical protein